MFDEMNGKTCSQTDGKNEGRVWVQGLPARADVTLLAGSGKKWGITEQWRITKKCERWKTK